MKIKRVLAFICALTVAVTALGYHASALTIGDTGKITDIKVNWQNPTNVVSIETQEKHFIVSTKTEKGKVNNLFFGFPVEGGLNFHADDTGFFKPEDMTAINYSTDGAAIVLKSENGTKVKVYTTASPWRFEVYNSDDEMVVYYLSDHIFFGYDDSGKLARVKIAAAVDEDETLFGLGERFSGLVQNGKTVEMWNYDCFGQLRRSYGDHNVGYKNIPILHSNNGYTVFHNNNYYGIADVAKTNKKEYSFDFYSSILDMYVWTGTTLENINSYNRLTGSTVTVPKYALSYWAGQSTSRWTAPGSSEDTVYETVKTTLDQYEELNTPIKVIFLEAIACNSKYGKLQDYLKSKNIKSIGWMNSQYRTFDDSPDYTAAKIAESIGFTNVTAPLVRWSYSKLSHYYDGGGYKFLDYADENSVRWLNARLNRFMDKGLIGMMVDFNDGIMEDAYYPSVDADGRLMHNLSQYYYAKATYEAFEKYYGAGNFVNIVRAGTAGSQSYGAVFAGDQTSTFLGLTEVVSSLLSSAASGINVWGSDIGGLGHMDDINKNDPELYARWLEFATFTPLMRAHGQTSWRHPWAYSDSSVDLFRKYYWTREAIVDLVHSGIIRASVENYPLTQSMAVAFPEQRNLATNDSQYIFCDSLLVCPITESKAASASVQFPKGRWVSLWDGMVYNGGSTETVSATLDTIPVYIQSGTAIPVTLGEELKIGGINTLDKNVEALMIAPAAEKKVNTVYLDKQTKTTYTGDCLGDNIYSVVSDSGSDKRIVVAMGLAAESVSVDAKPLKELSTRPTSGSTEAGFYRDLETNSTIIVTGGKWKYMEYSGGNDYYKNIALGAKVEAEGLSKKNAAGIQNITDGDYSTDLTLTEGKKTALIVDLKQEYALNKILVKWGGEYAKSFTLQVSNSSGDDAEWLDVYEKNKGGGGCDTVLLDGEKSYRYIRLTKINASSKMGAKLVEIEAYADETATALANKTVSSSDSGESGDFSVILWSIVGGVSVLILIGSAIAIFFIIKSKGKKMEA